MKHAGTWSCLAPHFSSHEKESCSNFGLCLDPAGAEEAVAVPGSSCSQQEMFIRGQIAAYFETEGDFNLQGGATLLPRRHNVWVPNPCSV